MAIRQVRQAGTSGAGTSKACSHSDHTKTWDFLKILNKNPVVSCSRHYLMLSWRRLLISGWLWGGSDGKDLWQWLPTGQRVVQTWCFERSIIPVSTCAYRPRGWRMTQEAGSPLDRSSVSQTGSDFCIRVGVKGKYFLSCSLIYSLLWRVIVLRGLGLWVRFFPRSIDSGSSPWSIKAKYFFPLFPLQPRWCFSCYEWLMNILLRTN